MSNDPLNSDEGTQFPTTREMRKRAYELLEPLPFDALVTYHQFREALQLDPAVDQRARTAVLQAGRDLLASSNKKIVNVKKLGYRIIKPNEHQAVSQSQQRAARRRLRDALQTVTHVALDHLTREEVAQVMIEQARAALQLAFSRKLARAKELPPREDLHLPAAPKLVELMRRKRG